MTDQTEQTPAEDAATPIAEGAVLAPDAVVSKASIDDIE